MQAQLTEFEEMIASLKTEMPISLNPEDNVDKEKEEDKVAEEDKAAPIDEKELLKMLQREKFVNFGVKALNQQLLKEKAGVDKEIALL